MSEALKQAYASRNGRPVDAFVLRHPGLTGGKRAFINARKPLTITLDSEEITFENAGINLVHVELSGRGQQDMSFEIDNTTLEASDELEKINAYNIAEIEAGREPPSITVSMFIFPTTDMPKYQKFDLVAFDTDADVNRLAIRASFFEMANVDFMNYRYYAENYPGTRHA